MEIKTKYNIGDDVKIKTFNGNNIVTIDAINIFIDKNNQIDLIYYSKNYIYYNQIDCKEEAKGFFEEDILCKVLIIEQV